MYFLFRNVLHPTVPADTLYILVENKFKNVKNRLVELPSQCSCHCWLYLKFVVVTSGLQGQGFT